MAMCLSLRIKSGDIWAACAGAGACYKQRDRLGQGGIDDLQHRVNANKRMLRWRNAGVRGYMSLVFSFHYKGSIVVIQMQSLNPLRVYRAHY